MQRFFLYPSVTFLSRAMNIFTSWGWLRSACLLIVANALRVKFIVYSLLLFSFICMRMFSISKFVVGFGIVRLVCWL